MLCPDLSPVGGNAGYGDEGTFSFSPSIFFSNKHSRGMALMMRARFFGSPQNFIISLGGQSSLAGMVLPEAILSGEL